MTVYTITDSGTHDLKITEAEVTTFFRCHNCVGQEETALMSVLEQYELLEIFESRKEWDDRDRGTDNSETQTLKPLPFDKIVLKDGRFAGFLCDYRITEGHGVCDSDYRKPCFVKLDGEPTEVFHSAVTADDYSRYENKYYKIVKKGSVVV